MEYRNGGANEFRHPISDCPVLSQVYGSVNLIENESENVDTHPYDETIDNFIDETEEDPLTQDWHDAATDDMLVNSQVLATFSSTRH